MNDLGWEAWYTLAVVAVMVLALVREWSGPPAVLGVALAALLVPGILTPRQALGGFANEGVITIAALFVVARAVQNTGGLARVAFAVLGRSSSYAIAMLRLMVPTILVSAFLNNTPVVAMLVPVVRRFAVQNDIAPSRLLIPLSYASILGGMCTLVGTSTNLVVSGMLVDQGYLAMGMFEMSAVGLFVAIVGLGFMLLVGRKLLPDRRDVTDLLAEERREYLVELMVTEECPLVGRSIEGAGLRHLKGLFLVHIERRGNVIGPVPPTEALEAGDRLLFTGLVSTIVDLAGIRGLLPVGDETHFDVRGDKRAGELQLFEVVISPTSPLVGLGIREAGFRNRYDAAVIAVHRAGQRVVSKIGDVVLKPGDTLLLEAPTAFARRWYDSLHFYLVSAVRGSSRTDNGRAPLVLAVLGAMIALPALGLTSMVVAAITAAAVLLVTRAVTPVGAQRSVDLGVLLVIAAALGVGKAIETTGLAALAADLVLGGVRAHGPVAVLAAVVIITNVFTELFNNGAAAALTFPVALATAGQLGADPRPFAIAVALGASASFATPLGYQTNLMVYGPGGYRFTDFLKVGLPMNAVVVAAIVFAVAGWWGLF
ncbi:MAG TPA: SLC13 family permease [Polyangia bacterium]|nr:SLC13 family permease [Polyangia bacterium]